MKSVLITGGTVRIGKAISDRLAAEGWRVMTVSHRPDAGADIVADFTQPSGAVYAYAEALRILGGDPPDALVNNAALFEGDAATLEAVNVVAPEKLTMLMAGRETGTGSVVNILDCRVLDGAACDSDYARTKRELLDYTRKSASLFIETLRVNAVAPGPVLAPTNVHENAGETPLGRPTCEDVAEAVSYFLSARSVTGTVIPVDGGRRLA